MHPWFSRLTTASGQGVEYTFEYAPWHQSENGEGYTALSLQSLESVKSRGQATISELVVFTQANRNTVKKHLENLVQAHHLTKHGAGKGTYYTLG